MKDILKNKYITLNKNELKTYLRILYDFGYKWRSNRSDMFNILSNLINTESIYIYLDNDGFLVWFQFYEKCPFIENVKTRLDIKKILREEKLKRILK